MICLMLLIHLDLNSLPSGIFHQQQIEAMMCCQHQLTTCTAVVSKCQIYCHMDYSFPIVTESQTLFHLAVCMFVSSLTEPASKKKSFSAFLVTLWSHYKLKTRHTFGLLLQGQNLVCLRRSCIVHTDEMAVSHKKAMQQITQVLEI